MHKYFEFEHSRVLQVLHAGLLISRSITSLNIFILIIFTADSLCNVGKHLLSTETDRCNVLFCVKNEKKIRQLSKMSTKEKNNNNTFKIHEMRFQENCEQYHTTLIIFELKLCNFHSPVTLKLCSLRQIKRIFKMTSEFSMKL